MPDSKVAQAYYLPSELIRWVNMHADDLNHSRSWVVERALSQYRKAIEAGH